MGGAIPPLPQYAFMAWCSVKKLFFMVMSSETETEVKFLLVIMIITKMSVIKKRFHTP